MTVPSPDLLARFAAIVGVGNALTAADGPTFAAHLAEQRGAYVGRSPMVLLPGSVAEISAILQLASESGTAIVPQGGNTGLVGGAVPDASGEAMVLALRRLNRIRSVDPDNDTMIVEAGVTLEETRNAAAAADRLFPLSLGAKATAQIGGNVSTNAGGTAVLAYGNTRDLVLGLEVVLRDGRVWDGLRTLRKDNAGYDLKHLFIGAEGTLGIVTAVAVKLFPRPRGTSLAVVGVASPEAALALFHLARARAGFELTSFELMPRLALDFCLRHLSGAIDPLAEAHAWYVLAEISSAQSETAARAAAEEIVAAGRAAALATAGRVAADVEEAEALWRLRYSLNEVQRPEGRSLKHDISVPVGRVPALIAGATAAVLAIAPRSRPVPFGHLGDGNIHFNVSEPEGGDDAFAKQGEAITEAVLATVAALGGSVAAEHGIGRMKRVLLRAVRSPLEMELMQGVKALLDPKGILNPGKVL